MTKSPGRIQGLCPEVLLASGRDGEFALSVTGLDDALTPSGFAVCRTRTRVETVSRVERGGLAAAVVWGDPMPADGLTVVRIIRSIDRRLPCWLVTRQATRQMLEEALALHVTSVMTHPVEVGELTLALRRVVIDSGMDN